MATGRTLALRRPIGRPMLLGLIAKAALVLTAGAIGTLVILRAAGDRAVARIWQRLESTPTTGEAFSAEMVADVPEPARRYFLTRSSREHRWRAGCAFADRKYPHWRAMGAALCQAAARWRIDGPWLRVEGGIATGHAPAERERPLCQRRGADAHAPVGPCARRRRGER